MFQSVNPATGETLKEIPEHTADEIEARLNNAASVWPAFSSRDALPQRLEKLARLGDILLEQKDELGRMITLEMGKPISQAIAEVEKCASCCEYYVENAERLLADTAIDTELSASYVRWLPIGPVLAVMPWNFPFWQVIRFAAPALAAGNVCLLKHASNVPQTAMKLEDLCLEAGFPVGAFQTLMIKSDGVEAVVSDDRVRAVTLTGSEGAGRAVAALAGRHIKKSVLELGGSDPFIIMPSADLKEAVDTAVSARVQNTGQSCIAAKRFIVHEDIYDAFIDRFIRKLSEKTIGDPLYQDTDIGPLATADIRDELADQVKQSTDAGAVIAYQGDTPDGQGNWYAPTVLVDIPEGTPAYDEELFGPVASVFRVSDVHEAIELANSSRLGLGSAAWTQDKIEQAALIDGLDAGFTAINGMTKSDPRLPFGGVKASGYGRELSDLGFREFLNAKTVTVS